MIRSFIFIVFSAIFLDVQGQNNFSISGKIDNRIDSTLSVTGPLKNGGYVYLEYFNGVSDSALIKNNSFYFEGKLLNSTPATLSHAHGGLSIMLSIDSKYDVEFTLSSPEKGLFEYISNITTDSYFHNSWFELSKRASILVNKRTELQTISQENINEAGDEIISINNSLNTLYSNFIKESSLLTLEKAFVLMGDPNFTYNKYNIFFFSAFSSGEGFNYRKTVQ